MVHSPATAGSDRHFYRHRYGADRPLRRSPGISATSLISTRSTPELRAVVAVAMRARARVAAAAETMTTPIDSWSAT